MARNRVNLYVDAANLFAEAREGNGRLDYGALLEYARRLGGVQRAALYAVRCNGSDKDKGFLVAVKQMGYTRVVARPTRQRPDGQSKSDLDTVIAMDVWEAVLAGEMNVVVLASGDSDFVPLVERLVDRGIEVHVIGSDRSTAWEMIVAATRFAYASQVPGLVQPVPPAPAAKESPENSGLPAIQKPGV